MAIRLNSTKEDTVLRNIESTQNKKIPDHLKGSLRFRALSCIDDPYPDTDNQLADLWKSLGCPSRMSIMMIIKHFLKLRLRGFLEKP